MPDEMNLDEDAKETEATPPLVHDDIMHRLLDYQRQLREGVTPEQAAERAASPVLVDYSALDAPTVVTEQTETIEVLDLDAVDEVVDEAAEEPANDVPETWSDASFPSGASPTQPMPAAADASGDLALRLAKLEDTLESIATSIGELREQFQNMAIAADERLAGIEAMLADARYEATAS
jgi:hypothetical protein